jgi:hypothetical protein
MNMEQRQHFLPPLSVAKAVSGTTIPQKVNGDQEWELSIHIHRNTANRITFLAPGSLFIELNDHENESGRKWCFCEKGQYQRRLIKTTVRNSFTLLSELDEAHQMRCCWRWCCR